ncbi:MAG TPA: glycine cleavage system aminomethyltransferase GcvT [Dehalococcoidia bacterium]|nr:glycine cleavage system aminomethyltransferase GcvT [Dehalococcoidia bacterium]
MNNLLKTSLHQTHINSKAKLVPFAGWEMPIQYSSILSECKAVRNQSGIFDVSHMGRFYISGNDASLALDKILSVNPFMIEEGQGKYNVICNQNGGIIDDAIVYKINDKKFLLIPNASNADTIHEWIIDNTKELNFNINVVTKNTAMIALQGPTSTTILNNIFSELPKIRRFRFIQTKYKDKNVIIARTGYTGENGFEIILDNDISQNFWELLLKNGATECGLGARDVLRLEAALALHGNEITEKTNPFEAQLSRFVELDRENYIVNNTLNNIKSQELSKKLIGFEIQGRKIARSHNIIKDDNNNIIGEVTSGTYSPTLNKSIGLGYISNKSLDINSEITIEIRSKNILAKIIKIPFYKRSN